MGSVDGFHALFPQVCNALTQISLQVLMPPECTDLRLVVRMNPYPFPIYLSRATYQGPTEAGTFLRRWLHSSAPLAQKTRKLLTSSECPWVRIRLGGATTIIAISVTYGQGERWTDVWP